jgi:hypothetical protein
MKVAFNWKLALMLLTGSLMASEPVYVFDWQQQKAGAFVNLAGKRGASVTAEVRRIPGRDGGMALEFNGQKGHAEAPANGNPTTFSGEAWIRIKGPAANKRQIVLIRRGRGNQWQFWLEPEGKAYRLYFFAWNSKAKNGLAVTGKAKRTIMPDKWQHVAFELDGERSCRIFINGNVVYDKKPVMPIGAGTSPLRIGGTDGYTFNGLIGEVKIYNGLLPQERMAAIKTSLLPAFKKDISLEEALGFERPGAWNTAPVEIADLISSDKIYSRKEHKGAGWTITAKTLEQLAAGAKLSARHVTQGKASLHWDRHAEFPTLACTRVPADWSGKKSLSLDIYSERATNEIVFVGVLSDSGETQWKDYLYFPLKIGWQGAKRISLPLAEFRELGRPVGFKQVGGVYFFTKMLGCQPNPYTDLYLDNMRLEDQADDSWKEIVATLAATHADGLAVDCSEMEWQLDRLNHDLPETADDQPVYAPYAYQYYFQNERAVNKYYPKFISGYPSFSPDGKTYINAGRVVQWKDGKGAWQVSDIEKTVRLWAKQQGWRGLKFSWTQNQSEKAIRLDRDGDAYLMVQIEELDEKGKTFSWKTRNTLLLHSRDLMKSWTVYDPPGRRAEFEKLDGHNREALERPPVMLLGDYKYFDQAEQAGYLLLPEKNRDGSLSFPPAVKYADHCIGVCQHSGGGNQAITQDGHVYIVYGWYVSKHARKGDWQQTCPPIPETHPGKNQSYIKKAHSVTTEYSKNGVPTFVVDYNLKTKKLGEPVFIGYGGGVYDNHNWPAITIDGKGYLHVVINGHHNPVNYTRSLKPRDISAWTDPTYIRVNTDKPNLSYATLNCDKKGNLYTVHRSTKDRYNNHLGLYRMTPDGVWEEEKTLVTPFKYMYKVWGHKMMYDPARDRLCLTFYGQSSMKQLSRDQYEFDIFFWPDHEEIYYSNFGKGGLNTGPPKPSGGCAMLVSPASEIASLISEDDGQKWKLATSGDFK